MRPEIIKLDTPKNCSFYPVGMDGKGNLYFVRELKDTEHTDIADRHSVEWLRPVTQEDLDDYRDDRENYYRECWAEDGRRGLTDLSLKDYIAEQADMDDPEWYPGRDDYDRTYVRQDIPSYNGLRRIIDLYAGSSLCKKIGTWEWGGCGWLKDELVVVFEPMAGYAEVLIGEFIADNEEK